MSSKYVLDDHGDPELCEDILQWSYWFEHDERRHVRKQQWTRPDGTEILVSTVFLGLDHNFGMSNRGPVLWETIVFVNGDGHDEYRYTSRADAIAGHNRVVEVEGGQVLE